MHSLNDSLLPSELTFTLISRILVFTFHRTAYQDRLDEVNKALAVFDRLKDYRPKRRVPGTPKGLKSGRITPPLVFGRYPVQRKPPFGDGAGHSRSGTPDPTHPEEGTAADVEDLGYLAGSDTEGAKRKSFLGLGASGKLKSKASPENIPMSPTKRVPGTNSAGPSRNVSEDFNGVARNQNDQQRLHTYPPSASPGAGQGLAPAEDAPEAQVLTQAAKVLKAAVLHDARNTKYKGQGHDRS